MDTEINLLVAIKLQSSEFEGLLPEDIAYYFIDNLKQDYEGDGTEIELLEVY